MPILQTIYYYLMGAAGVGLMAYALWHMISDASFTRVESGNFLQGMGLLLIGLARPYVLRGNGAVVDNFTTVGGLLFVAGALVHWYGRRERKSERERHGVGEGADRRR